MKIRNKQRTRDRGQRTSAKCAVVGILLLAICPMLTFAHESPIDHVNRVIRMNVKDEQLIIDYRLQMTPRTVLMQMRDMDADGSGHISDEEKRAYFETNARELSRALALTRDEQPIRIKSSGNCVLRPDLSNEYYFAANIGELAAGKHSFTFRDSFAKKYPGSIRGHTPIPEAGQLVELEVSEGSGDDARRGHAAEVVLLIEVTVAE